MMETLALYKSNVSKNFKNILENVRSINNFIFLNVDKLSDD